VSTPSPSPTSSFSQITDVLSQMNGLGTRSASYAEFLTGFNHRSIGAPLPIHAEGSGITFFTRPNFNLSYDNLSVDRVLTPLLTQNLYTYQRVIRAILDPIGSGVQLYDTPARSITSPLFDSKSAFIPMFTNALTGLTGWPDQAMDIYTSHEGILRETWVYADGHSKVFTATDLNATFRNVGGDPITLLLFVWLTYMDHIHRGTMTPYLRSILTNRIDYQTRIFRFTLDPTRTRIQKWASATGCFPVANPIGAAFNFTSDNAYTQENADSISTTFKAQCIEYFDPLIFNEFNETVQMFNPAMSDAQRAQNYTKVPYQNLQMFNWANCYPHINVLTSELEWWVDNASYTTRVANHTAFTTLPAATIAASTLSQAVLATGTPASPAASPAPYQVTSAFGYQQFLTGLDNANSLITAPGAALPNPSASLASAATVTSPTPSPTPSSTT
jgi:hypothetical protein